MAASRIEVEILEACMVTPSEATPKHRLWLSNLDLMYRSHTPMIFLYRRPAAAAGGLVSPSILKTALSKALVPYYPFAGRLASHSSHCHRPEIRCTGEGVLFVTARAEATTLDEFLGSHPPAPPNELRRRLVPSSPSGDELAMFQVTLFRCGGVCLGTAVHHIATDGRAFSAFLHTWAAIARGAGETCSPPCLDRTLLRARSPPAVRFDHVEYSRRGDETPTIISKSTTLTTAILGISRSQVKALKDVIAVSTATTTTTFNAVAAHVWRRACMAVVEFGSGNKEHSSDTTSTTSRVYLTADGRSRLRPPLPANYLGNAIVRTSAVATVGDIASSPIGAAADMLAGAISRLNGDYIRSLLDYMEQARSCTQGMLPEGWFDPDTDLVFVSYLGASLYSSIDFGWGPPAFLGRASSLANGYVHLVPVPDDTDHEDGHRTIINVVVAMEPRRLSRFKHLFYNELNLASQVKHSRL